MSALESVSLTSTRVPLLVLKPARAVCLFASSVFRLLGVFMISRSIFRCVRCSVRGISLVSIHGEQLHITHGVIAPLKSRSPLCNGSSLLVSSRRNW
eukprot:163674-Pyramimonas_sp.AAC.1